MKRQDRDRLSFTCPNVPALQARGVAGPWVSAWLDETGLNFSGDEGGRVTIDPASVDRIRQFHSPRHQGSAGSMSGSYETRIWWDGGKQPVIIGERRGYGYRAAIAGFAAQVAELRGPERLEIGPGYAFAIVNALIVLLPLLGLGGFMLWNAARDGGPWWLAVAAILAALLWLAYRNLSPRWPRRAGSLDRFLARLPQE